MVRLELEEKEQSHCCVHRSKIRPVCLLISLRNGEEGGPAALQDRSYKLHRQRAGLLEEEG